MTMGTQDSLYLEINVDASQYNIYHDGDRSEEKDVEHLKKDSDDESGGAQSLYSNDEEHIVTV